MLQKVAVNKVIGMQGLADALLLPRYPLEGKRADTLGEDLFDASYFTACEARHRASLMDSTGL